MEQYCTNIIGAVMYKYYWSRNVQFHFIFTREIYICTNENEMKIMSIMKIMSFHFHTRERKIGDRKDIII